MRTALFLGLLILSKSIAAQTGFSTNEDQQDTINMLVIAFIVADSYELIIKGLKG